MLKSTIESNAEIEEFFDDEVFVEGMTETIATNLAETDVNEGPVAEEVPPMVLTPHPSKGYLKGFTPPPQQVYAYMGL